jgi:hypothetical protein
MTNQSNASRRPAADAAVPGGGNFEIGRFFESMVTSRRHEPQPIELLITPLFFDETWRSSERGRMEEVLFSKALEFPGSSPDPRDDISIFLVVTDVRVILPQIDQQDWAEPYYQAPEYEVEGWLLNPPRIPKAKVWVRCRLRTTDTEQLEECTVYPLERGEEHGTEPTLGFV